MRNPAPPPIGILRPSSAPRWGECYGSAALEALYPELEDSPEAREGTAGHFYPTEYLLGRVWPIGTVTPNGHPIDADMVKYGQIFIDDVYATVPTMGAMTSFRVEELVTAHGLIHPENEGTPDAYAIDLAHKFLVVWDYKYGHKFVEPYRNLQVVNYVAGIFERHEITQAEAAGWRVSIRIVQPRFYAIEGKVRTWETLGSVIWPLIEKLSVAACAAKQPGAPTLTGPWCGDCKARHSCEAFRKLAGNAAQVAGSTIPHDMEAYELGSYLREVVAARKALEAMEDGLKAVGISMLRSGKDVPYWGMGYVDSRERWNKPVSEVVTMGKLMGVDLAVPGAKTPAEARKAGIPEALVKSYSIKPTGAAKLTPLDETAAAKAFGS